MTKYVESKDSLIDQRMIGNLTAEQKKLFKKLDEKHRKVKTQEADNAIDKGLIKKAEKAKPAKSNKSKKK